MRFSPFLLSSLTALLLLSGCDKHEKTDNSATPVVTTAQKIQNVTPPFGDYDVKITAAATVQPSPDGIVSINSPVNGVVSKILVNVGDKVKVGSPLLSITSSDVSDASSNDLGAKAAFSQAKHNYEMNQKLYALGAITENDLVVSKSNYEQAKAVLEGFAQKLSYLGASSNQALVLRSSIDGVVYDIATHLGDKVTTDVSQPLLKIVNPHKKVVVATVYEKDIPAFTIGKEVEIKLDGHEQILSGKITYISDVQDPENKTTKIYITPTEDSPKLRVNMFANVVVNVTIHDVYRVPKQAVLFKDSKFIVYLDQNGTYIPFDVTIVNDSSSDQYSLIQGLSTNSRIALEPIALNKE